MRVLGRVPKRTSLTSKRASLSLPSFFFGLLIASMCSILLGLIFPELTPHLLIIVSFSGALASADFIDVVRRQRDFFSPRSLVSLIMVIAVYVSPVVHISLEAYPKNITLPDDMVEAFTELATLHLIGLSLYFFILRIFPTDTTIENVKQTNATESAPYINSLRRWTTVLGLVSLGVFAYTVMYVGGPQSWFLGQIDRSARGVLSGAVLSFAEAFPVLFFIAYSLYLKSSSLSPTQIRTRIVIAIVLLLAITFLTSGLRGSRANIVWPTLSALAMIHLLFFRIRLRVLVIIALIGATYAGAYDIYKKTGPEGLEQLQSGSVDSLNDYVGYGFGPAQLLLGDFSRTGVQTVLLDRWNSGSFRPYLGVTYVGDTIEFIPGAERVEALPSKSVAGTEVLYGEGSSITRTRLSTRIYGLPGEALINFGPLGGILIFFPYAVIVSLIERAYKRAEAGVAIGPAIFVPLLLPATVLTFLSDLDNVLNNLTSMILLPVLAAGLSKITTNGKTSALSKASRKVPPN